MRFAPLLLLSLGLAACPSDDGAPTTDEPGDVGTADDDDDAVPGVCAPARTLACGDTVVADTSDPNSGATTVMDGYPVATGNYAAAELVYAFESTTRQEVWWGLVGSRPTELDQDVFVLEGSQACDPEHAFLRGFNSTTFTAEPGATYYLVVDGFAGAEGAFVASLECEGGELPTDSPGADAYGACAFGQNSRDLMQAPHLDIELVANPREPGDVPALVADQMLAGVQGEGWADVDTLAELWDYVDDDGVYIRTVILETTGERFDWIRWYAGDTEVGYLYTAGSLQQVAIVSDQDIYDCAVYLVD